MTSNLESFSFTLVLRRVDAAQDELEDAIYEAGCNDGMVGLRNGAVYIDFDRQAACFDEAVLSAIEAVERAGVGARVSRIEPGDLVTAAEVARRLNKSRESVRLWMEGERGPGGFPLPVSGVSGSLVLWSWAEVARWLAETGRIDDSQLYRSEVIADVNGALEERECPRHSKRRHAFLARLGGRGAKTLAARNAGRRTNE